MISRAPSRQLSAVGAFPARLALDGVEQVSASPAGIGPVQVEEDGTTITAMPRPALAARGTSRETDVHVVSVHLKSKLLSFPRGRFSPSDEAKRARYGVYALDRRGAEAATVRGLATRVLRSTSA